MDQNKVTAILMLDLSKAFDSIHHETLLQKLRGLGVSHETLKWFVSYLSGRVQRVRIITSLNSPLMIKQYLKFLYWCNYYSTFTSMTYHLFVKPVKLNHLWMTPSCISPFAIRILIKV